MLTRIGEIEVWRILELNGPFMPPEVLFPTAGPDVAQVIDGLSPATVCAETGKLIIPIQAYLLKTPGAVILVDACVGNDKTNEGYADWHKLQGTRFMAGLTAAGITPGDVNYVLCTHLHSDHVGWNTRLENGQWVPTFPKARYLMPKADELFYRDQDRAHYHESVSPVIVAGQAEMVEAGHQLGDHVTLVASHGHTPGHVSIQLRSHGQEALITGDVIHCTAQCQHPDWHFRFDADPEEAVLSRRALLERASESGATVLGTHFRLPSIGRVLAKGDAFEWEDR